MERMFEIGVGPDNIEVVIDLKKISYIVRDASKPEIDMTIDGDKRTLVFQSNKDRDYIFKAMYNALKEIRKDEC